MTTFLLPILLLATNTSEACVECKALDNFFAKTDLFLRTHVSNGLVDYSAIKEDPATLNELVALMSGASLAGEGAATTKAFWINAYNVTMIKSVVENMPIDKPLDVPGMFDTKQHKVAGQVLTLNDIENKKLRDVFHDARIHFVLVCGAKGCPVLISGAYMPTSLETQLLTQTRNAINNSVFTKVDAAAKTVRISEIFKWYEGDFTTGGKTVLQYINQYRTTPIPADYKVAYYTYDWSLNIQK
jgi:hypothetical protein